MHCVTVMRFWIKIGTSDGLEGFVIVTVYNGDLAALGCCNEPAEEVRYHVEELKSHLNPDATETNKLKHM